MMIDKKFIENSKSFCMAPWSHIQQNSYGTSVGSYTNGYDAGTGYWLPLQIEDGTWNPEFGGTEYGEQGQMGMRIGVNPHIFHYKRSRGLLFKVFFTSI